MFHWIPRKIVYFFIEFIEIESHVAENKQIENRSQSTSRLEPSWKSAFTHWEPVDFINIFTYVGDYRLDPITPRKDNKKIDAGILRNFHISNPDNIHALLHVRKNSKSFKFLNITWKFLIKTVIRWKNRVRRFFNLFIEFRSGLNKWQ